MGQDHSQDEKHETPGVSEPSAPKDDRRLVIGALLVGGGAVALVALVIVGALTLLGGGDSSTDVQAVATVNPTESASSTPAQRTVAPEDVGVLGFFKSGFISSFGDRDLGQCLWQMLEPAILGEFTNADITLASLGNATIMKQLDDFASNFARDHTAEAMAQCFNIAFPTGNLTGTSIDASQLLTPLEIGSALGGDWHKGTLGCLINTCYFDRDNGGILPDEVSLTVLKLSDSPEQDFHDRTAGAFVTTSLDHAVSGVGDEAYWSRNNGLSVRKGNIDITVLVTVGGAYLESESLSTAKIVLDNLAQR
jgi:hypothetical protein